MNNADPAEFFKCFADKTRLDIISILSSQDSYVEYIASALSLTSATVCFHLKKLEANGLVSTRREQFYIMYSLNRELLDKTVGEIIACVPEKEPAAPDSYEKSVLNSFFRYGKLTALPVQRKKREIVLREIAGRFERGRDYDEKEVNAIISALHDDYCTIRRDLIGFGMMTRDHEIYRRL